MDAASRAFAGTVRASRRGRRVRLSRRHEARCPLVDAAGGPRVALPVDLRAAPVGVAIPQHESEVPLARCRPDRAASPCARPLTVKVLACHNRYAVRGGEDIAFDTAVQLWRGTGHEVRVFERDNARLTGAGLAVRLKAARRMVYDPEVHAELDALADEWRPH